MLYTFSGNLVHLVTLDVSHNNITSIPHGKSSRTIEISISLFCNAGLMYWHFPKILLFVFFIRPALLLFILESLNVLEEKN